MHVHILWHICMIYIPKSSRFHNILGLELQYMDSTAGPITTTHGKKKYVHQRAYTVHYNSTYDITRDI